MDYVTSPTHSVLIKTLWTTLHQTGIWELHYLRSIRGGFDPSPRNCRRPPTFLLPPPSPPRPLLSGITANSQVQKDRLTMRFLALVGASSLAGVALGQFDGLPECAIECVGDNLGGCNELDVTCICSDDALLSNLSCCLDNLCNRSDQESG